MIFENIRQVKDTKGFIEKILIYCRLVELVAERYNATIVSYPEINMGLQREICDMGIIYSTEDCDELKKLLRTNYTRFIACVNFYLSNQNLYGNLLYKLNNKKREELQSQNKRENKPTFVDFFSGAGGLSCGFTQAGYRCCLANDFEEVCVNTYVYNHPELPANKVIKEDIRNITNEIDKYIVGDIDVVIGGPPCQGFSSANQQRIIDDPRNELYKYYIEVVKKICPKFVLMENVRGMLSVASQVVEDYQAIHVQKDGRYYSYDIAFRLLNAVKFGVAQNRERLIYIAVRDDVVANRHITPELIFREIEAACSNNSIYNLEMALEHIKPLNAPRVKGLTEKDDEASGMKIDWNNYNSCGNPYLSNINEGRQIPMVYNHKARYCSDVNYEIFRRLEQGEDSTSPKIADIMPYTRRNGIFKDKYFRLYSNKPCRTITAHLRMDCLSHIHPTQIRSITPREAARVQSFPDDYFFLGPYLKTYMQVGNAVPVLMAKQIALAIKKHI
ncbi:MAG: DNA cytosine methyltransferase [Prevotella sp.]|nr:DNA cytosine methyltransferase [Prevotella sp.]